VPFVRTNASVLLDLVRGLAAFLVVIGHGRNFLFLDYHELPTHSIWVSILYLITKAGHQGVIVFFVLSGYLISGSVFRSVERGIWSWPSYLTHRLVRLWVVLLPGLLLCALLDHLALTHHLAPAIYQAGAANHMSIDVASRLTPLIFLQNLFFLQVMVGPTFGSDTALWSLAYEFWFYILFPLGLFALSRRSKLPTRLVSAVLFLVIAWCAHAYLDLFPVWLAGTLLVMLPPLKLRAFVRVLVAALYVPFFFFCASDRLLANIMDYVLAIATLLFLWVLLSANSEARATLGVRSSRQLARFSYTVYVVHTPFLLFLTALIVGEGRWTPNPFTFLKSCGVIALVFVYAYAVAAVTEFRTDNIRHWIERRFRILRPPAPTTTLDR